MNPTEARDLAWQADALCAQVDPELFFPEKGGSGTPAKNICRSCDVAAECLEYSLLINAEFGVWGGLSAKARNRLAADTSAA